jgi:beta-ureidopropionase / N-carbamoyl-L-amino-acid hydrolase
MDRRSFAGTLVTGLAPLVAGVRAATRPSGAPVDAADALLDDVPPVNGERLNAHITALSELGKNPQGGVSRVAYSDADKQGRAYVTGLMRDAGLDVRVDAAGNIYGRRAGRDASLKPILFGSHVDSVPEGGNFDGPVGSLAAIEVAHTFRERNVVTRHPLEITIWQNEEGGLVGSRAASGELETRELTQITSSGKTIGDGIAFIGGDVARLADARRAPGSIAAYLELHIEQGATLDTEKLQIGIVEGIVGVYWWDVTITGFANHAGTTAMNRRRDALLSAAAFIEAVNRVVTSVPGRQVGTVGKIQAFPGARNVIPGKVTCTLELRDLDAAKVRTLYGRIEEEAKRIAAHGGTTIDLVEATGHAPAMTDPAIRAAIERSAKSLGLTTTHLPSGAGHDAQSMARLGPMGMIFVPSIGGISHSPKEFSRPEDITNGANVLARSVVAVDASA